METIANGKQVAAGTVFFIFGATGDLAKRKLFPAIFSMYREGKISDNFGCDRISS